MPTCPPEPQFPLGNEAVAAQTVGSSRPDKPLYPGNPMLIPTLVTAALLILAIEILVATRSPAFKVERTIHIHAPPERVFALVEDFKSWEQWSPWANIDPNMRQTYSGPATGVGSRHEWSGNRKAGAGSQTIVESDPPKRLGIRLEFEKPFKASNRVEFVFTPEDHGTRAQWIMTGVNKNIIWRHVSLLVSMDKMVGGDFEKGLAQLKALAEATPA